VVRPDDKTTVSGGGDLPEVGGYKLIKQIGFGGAGRVFEARDDALGRTVAIKVLHPQVAADKTNVERFLREARAMANVRSPHVAAVYGVGKHQKTPYIVMEFFEGQNLEQRLKKDKRIPVDEALVYARDCALALKAGDDAGIVHRDVKPANIVVKNGRAVLTDFGLARPMDGSANMTVEGQIAGTATFMAPDRITGQGDDLRADIYSLGATLYCLLCGRPPFEKANPIDVIAAHLNEEPTPLTERVKGLSPRVADVVKRMMAKSPNQRQQNYDDLIEQLEDLLAGDGAVDEGLVDENTEVLGVGTQDIQGPAISELPDAPDMADANDPFGAAATPDSQVGMPTGVMGTLKQMGVVDICHMLEMGRKDAVIELNADGGFTGELCFRDGQVVFCTWGNLEGEEAFYDICRRKEGFFRIHYGRRSDKTNIHGNNQGLMLEAMRRLDESSRAMPSAPGKDAASSRAMATPSDFGPPVLERPDITVPEGDPIFSEDDGPELPPQPPSSPFGVPPTGGAAAGLPAPPPPPSSPRPIKAGAPVGLAKHKEPAPPVRSYPAPPQTPAPVDVAPPAASYDAPPKPATKPAPVPASPAPMDAPTMPTEALVESEDDGPAMPPQNDTMLWDASQEQAMREATGKPAPKPGLGDMLSDAWNDEVLPWLRGVSARNDAFAGRLESDPRFAVVGKAVRGRPWFLPVVGVGLVLASVLFVALIFAAVSGGGASDDATIARIDAGEANAVLAEIDEIAEHERTGLHHLMRGHALARLLRSEEAITAYRAAQRLGAGDSRSIDVAVGMLDQPEPTAASAFLIDLDSAAVTDKLLAQIRDRSWARRHNALYVLEERGEADSIDFEALAVQDLLEGPTCKHRRLGLLDLRKVGRTEAARDAFTKALALKDSDNACMRNDLEQMAGNR
jgi:serine/threonine protein kinase